MEPKCKNTFLRIPDLQSDLCKTRWWNSKGQSVKNSVIILMNKREKYDKRK